MQQVRFYLLRTIETSHLPNQNPESRGVEEQYVLPRVSVTVAKRGSHTLRYLASRCPEHLHLCSGAMRHPPPRTTT